MRESVATARCDRARGEHTSSERLCESGLGWEAGAGVLRTLSRSFDGRDPLGIVANLGVDHFARIFSLCVCAAVILYDSWWRFGIETTHAIIESIRTTRRDVVALRGVNEGCFIDIGLICLLLRNI